MGPSVPLFAAISPVASQSALAVSRSVATAASALPQLHGSAPNATAPAIFGAADQPSFWTERPALFIAWP